MKKSRWLWRKKQDQRVLEGRRKQLGSEMVSGFMTLETVRKTAERSREGRGKPKAELVTRDRLLAM